VRFNRLLTLTIGTGLLLFAGRLLAHHSFAGQFDAEKMIAFKGVVSKVDFINPHLFIYLDVKGENGQQHWALEGPGMNQYLRMGFDKETFKVGDSLEVCGYQTKDDSALRTTPSGGSSRPLSSELLTLSSGQQITWGYGQKRCLQGK
jgi:hypothetical protein